MSRLNEYIEKANEVEYNEGMKEVLDRWGAKLKSIFKGKPRIKKSVDGKIIKPLEVNDERI